ncbi:hypothetical protein [Streptomyces sp. NPDC093598]|uniref:hypothetical protein n=1 Tax=Streptomyces sp. NPDC093598 TaxID=3366046 RepID=UPI003803906D
MKGDRVERAVDAGDTTRTREVVASGVGRRVETGARRGVVEVSEVTRWGSPRPFRQWERAGRPVGEDPETRVPVSTQGSTSQVATHPPGGPAIGTRA